MKAFKVDHDMNIDYIKNCLYNLKFAIKNDLDIIHIGYDTHHDEEYKIEKTDIKAFLSVLLTRCIELEEYEICNEIKSIL